MTRAIAAALTVTVMVACPAAGTSAQAPPTGGVVTILSGRLDEPPCLSVLVLPCAAGVLPLSAVLYGAYQMGPDAVWRPALVYPVAFTTRPPFTLTYRIRPEARWSDGVPISARDFVFTQEAIRRYAHRETFEDQLTQVRSVRALDPKTVRVVLRSRFAAWRTLFGVVLPRHALQDEDLSKVWLDRIDNPKTGRPIASGPFLVERWDRGKQLRLVRNPRWWGPHRPYLDGIVFHYPVDAATLGGAAIAALFRKREIDVSARVVGSSDDLVSELRRTPGIHLRFSLANAWEQFTFRTKSGGHPALRNKLVRRALAYAIDRVALVRTLFGDVVPTQQPLDSAISLATDASYRPNWSLYRHDPAKARALLAQVGCRRGSDGIYSCAGERLSLRFISRGAAARRARTLELVRAQLRQVGIEALESYVPSAAHNEILTRGDFDATLFSWFVTSGDESQRRDQYACGGSRNFSGYCQRLLTREVNQAELILQMEERARVLNRVDVQLARDVPVLPLFQVPFVFGVRSTIRGFVAHPVDATWKAENWWLAR